MSIVAMKEWVETIEWNRALTVGRAAVFEGIVPSL
jgi:hypothetical protein